MEEKNIARMTYVKASERLPEVKEKWYWCKIERLGFKGAFYFDKHRQFSSLIENKYDNEEIQWLDEPE